MLLASDDWFQIGFRLFLALLVGCSIGLNRQKGGRPAGMRTFMLVSMGSALFVMIPLQAEGDSLFATTNALSRTIQGVTTGVGFIGAGLILQVSPGESANPKVKGLTTAASVWISAGLGAAIGCGLWQTALMAGFLTLVTLSGVKRLSRVIEFRVSHADEKNIFASSDTDDEF
ncbi:MgtC/SapB family protein [Calothrix sp. 336/3]|uniref:MgtC/SapB family protein n=1 Tax=Calothrix sp. 336/3 TaxID=1337936 RepID=UPI00054DD1F0|nr:protein SrpB [Calothrix sp. 336/3]